MTSYYGSIDRVKKDSGILPNDLGLTEETELEELIQEYFLEAKSLIDEDRNQDLLERFGSISEIPKCIHSVANRLVVNMIKQAKINRESPIINVEEYKVSLIDDTVFTISIEKDLSRCIGRKLDTGLFLIDTGK